MKGILLRRLTDQNDKGRAWPDPAVAGEGMTTPQEFLTFLLEREPHHQVEAAVRRLAREKASGNRIRLSKNGRSEVADRRREVHEVKDVVGHQAELEVVSPVGGLAAPKAPAATAAAQAATSKPLSARASSTS